jgi:hypothetical protein
VKSAPNAADTDACTAMFAWISQGARRRGVLLSGIMGLTGRLSRFGDRLNCFGVLLSHQQSCDSLVWLVHRNRIDARWSDLPAQEMHKVGGRERV